MSHPLYHARSSAKLFGGNEADYYHLHTFFDQTKACVPTNLHRLILHNDFGMEVCEQIFGPIVCRPSDGERVPTCLLARQHVREDFGFLPTLSTCLQNHPLHREKGATPLLTQEEQTMMLSRKLRGEPEDYCELVAWFARPGELLSDPRFFRVLGNSFGIFLAEQHFGISIERHSDRKRLPTRYIAEQLVLITLGYIPPLSHFFRGMVVEPWMCRGAQKLSRAFEGAGEDTASNDQAGHLIPR